MLSIILMGMGSAWAQTTYHTETYDFDNDGVYDTFNVVYINLGNGNNSRAGDSPTNAVKKWDIAYSKLPAYTGTTDADRDYAWDHNIIVVCDMTETIAIQDENTGNRPATITGTWPWTADNITYAKVITGGGVKVDAGNESKARLGADTKFKYIRFSSKDANNKAGYLCMYLHDAIFDVGCVMEDFVNLTTANGATAGRTAPDMEVFLFANTYNFTVGSSSKPDGGWPQQTKPVTLTIRSGKFGRILSNRITGTTDNQIKQRYVIGNPDHPLMCVINVDIDPSTTTGAWNPQNYPDDIAFLCAGMTQGAEYCDVEFNITRGKIATLVGAMQGNSITNTPNVNLSNSSFFGRTKVTLNPTNDNDVVIQRYFAGCLGRETGGQTGIANAAFYGQSILNMYGGTIESGAHVSAGGISGLKSADGAHHTTDKFIPYVDPTAVQTYPYMGIRYKQYDAAMAMPKVNTTLHGSAEEIDLEKTSAVFNIYGGIINGGLYGGSYGFSSEMPTERTMPGAGSLWGETTINIYGGTITGGVYGGGMGAPTYYNTAADNRKVDFLTVASVYGDTHVNIYGGTIIGNIYGGGKGTPYQAQHIETTTIGSKTYTNYTCPENEFLEIAKVYGNTNVTINPTDPSWTYEGNIYGGGAMGAVEGNTNVQIQGGHINGSVFAASAGERGQENKGKVEGDPSITISGGTISQNIFGGGELASVQGDPTVTVNDGTISQSVFGGGLGAENGGAATAQVNGKTNVNIFGGAIGTDIYGGGKGVASTNVEEYLEIAKVIGATNVLIDPKTLDPQSGWADPDVPEYTPNPSWEHTGNIYGGGALGAVVGNTDVKILDGIINGNVFGAGKGEDGHPNKAKVTGNTSVTIDRNQTE